MTGIDPDKYVLLDSGRGRKLEQVGPYLLERQAPHALWDPRLPKERWGAADAVHHRSETGGGHWEFNKKLPESWQIKAGEVLLHAKPTPFGHLGLFPEQVHQWHWMQERIARRTEKNKDTNVLNLFAYTGGATLACSRAGADVCHLDASKGVVTWARENAELNGLQDRPIRWIVDDATTFARREGRRESTYHGIILDPPTYGKGKGKNVWKIEEHLPELLRALAPLIAPDPAFILLSCHTPGFTPTALTNLLFEVLHEDLWEASAGELTIADSTGRPLPSGTVVRCLPH